MLVVEWGNPRRYQRGASRRGNVEFGSVFMDVAQQSDGDIPSSAITTQNDLPGRDLEGAKEEQIGREGILQRRREGIETRISREAVLQRKDGICSAEFDHGPCGVAAVPISAVSLDEGAAMDIEDDGGRAEVRARARV